MLAFISVIFACIRRLKASSRSTSAEGGGDVRGHDFAL